MKIGDIPSSDLVVKFSDPLIKAASLLGGEKGRYRLPVIDEECKVEGIISGRRIIEVLVGRRGTSLIEERGLDTTLREPVNLFMDETHQLFFDDVRLDTVLKYLCENAVGHVILVDQSGRFKGMVEEVGFLERLKGKNMGISVGQIMSSKIQTEEAQSTILEASRKMVNERLRRLPVTDKGKVVGIITVSDILRELTRARNAGVETAVVNIFKKRVKELMSRKLVGIDPDTDAGAAVRSMLDMDISGLVVFQNQQLLGIVSRVDLLGRCARIKGIERMIEMMV